jgi:ribosome-binding protein aMBF1 (putative translation factor)
MTTQEKAKKTFAIYAKARTVKGINDYTVSKEAGLRPSCICDWKRGAYTPKFEKLIKIARVLDIPVEMFVEVLDEH